MSVIVFFFLLTLQPHGHGQPTRANQTLTREPLLPRIKRNFFEDDDYEYTTPKAEMMDQDNLTTLSLVTAEGAPQGTTKVPVTMDLVQNESMTLEATKGKSTMEELTTEATERPTTNPPLTVESTSGLPSKGQQITHDLTTTKVVTGISEIVIPTTEESTFKAPSSGVHTAGDVGTDTVTMSTMGNSTTDPSVMVTLPSDTGKPKTIASTIGQLTTDSVTPKEPTTSLPAELKSNYSSPTSSLNESALFYITVHPIHNFSTTSSPPSSSHAHSDPPMPKVATEQIRLTNTTALVAVATTAQGFISGNIPVRQCLLAVLILALIATIFLICTVVLAIRLSKKGHTYPVRDYSPTEMVCISSLLAEGEGPPMANGVPANSKTQLLKSTPEENCSGDDLTLHSFIP
ncbi:P-selectin glycoprotein ligand 1 [Macrotis lagotis]|uniref:P-selectin glycoprotein ligand 1 n=1 Tax=Macrotis lagotis TaxID=92651 RepID=UPI003D69FB9E